VSEPPFADPTVCRIVEFLKSIGLGVQAGSVPEITVVPGIHIVRGELVVDEARLTYPGDLLHEAGHVVVRPKDAWESINGDVGGHGGEEMAAMAWSYAASVHLGIDPAVVFHSGGYKGESNMVLDCFTAGAEPLMGVPVLQWMGMTADTKSAAELGVSPFPAMLKWTR
jgi:hypothetical protein